VECASLSSSGVGFELPGTFHDRLEFLRPDGQSLRPRQGGQRVDGRFGRKGLQAGFNARYPLGKLRSHLPFASNLTLKLDDLFRVGLLQRLELLTCRGQGTLVLGDTLHFGYGFLDLSLQLKQLITSLLFLFGWPGDVDEAVEIREQRDRIALGLAADSGGFPLPVGLDVKGVRSGDGIIDIVQGAVQRAGQRMDLLSLIAPEQVELGGPDFGIDQIAIVRLPA
jgi:hypothetical protein